MLIVHVFFHVKPEQVEEFKKASMENAQDSIKETGVISFDVLQQQDDSSRLLFVEIYRAPHDQSKHRETEHYKKWRQSIEDMLAEPYTAIKYNNISAD
ncbi:putative quinol monooxygenase [Desulfitobacterium sp.]|uniref:putative quinol monooxygenase n=1 Tax=Desulfitobacterium sp. TaxID=49981 RepID=UPI002C62025A|nr:putative quinol monooxygenase [Desulfitobacterium sp.]HVJ48433.1 putative quinol monooxygenase [Desulfitobacterium sp.]